MSNGRVAKVLVVDDEPALRELLIDSLSGPGVEVSVAGSGREAIQLAEANRPDLVVADLNLGDCSGLNVIDELRIKSADLPCLQLQATKNLTPGELGQQMRETLKDRRKKAVLEPRDLAQKR